MSLNAEALRLMAEKGLSLSDVVEIAAAMERRKDPTAAERQSRRRAKLKGNEDALVTRDKSRRDVTRDPLPNDIYSNPTPEPLQLPDGSCSPAVSETESGEGEKLQPEHVLEAFNDAAGRIGNPKARMTPARRKRLLTLIRSHSLDDFTEAIAAFERSRFCRGENDRGWKADFDFFLQDKSFNRLIEGSYDGS